MDRSVLLLLTSLLCAPAAAADRFADGFADLAAQVEPTVVYVEADLRRVLCHGLQQLFSDYDLPTPSAQGAPVVRSGGSGVIVGADGLVLTNHHVVDGAQTVRLTTVDKRSYTADVVGSDPRTDVAVLQIRGGERFHAAPIGDSDEMRVGAWVIAVGHPFDFRFSLSVGVVSARGRHDVRSDEIQDYIQTDAAVNPGSSGGPLFNTRGQVIGINTAIFSSRENLGQNAGVAFAIPSNMAWGVADELLSTGRVLRAGLGLDARDSPPDPQPGAEITRIVPDSPAERAGLRRADIIVRVDGEPVSGSADLKGVVQAARVGQPLDLEWERGDRLIHARCVAADRRALGRVDVIPPPDAVRWGGMLLAPVQPDWAARFGVNPPQDAGAIVLSVDPRGAADMAGLVPGDLLLRVADQPVTDPSTPQRAAARRAAVGLEVWHQGGRLDAVLAGLGDR